MSDGKHFQDHIAETRARLTEERRVHLEDRQKIDGQLAEIDREFAAIEAYEAAKTGKRANTPRQQRARRGSRREELIELIRNSDGLSRGEILERMGLKGDKAGAMSVSNALVAMKKQNAVSHEGGRYYAPVARDETMKMAQAAE